MLVFAKVRAAIRTTAAIEHVLDAMDGKLAMEKRQIYYWMTTTLRNRDRIR